jgi:hypothetical protein
VRYHARKRSCLKRRGFRKQACLKIRCKERLVILD